jgi:hypothetical protein
VAGPALAAGERRTGILDGRVSLADIRAAIEHRLTWCRGCARCSPFPGPGRAGHCGRTRRCSTSTDHVHVLHVPAPGDEAALLTAVEGLIRRRLDHTGRCGRCGC